MKKKAKKKFYFQGGGGGKMRYFVLLALLPTLTWGSELKTGEEFMRKSGTSTIDGGLDITGRVTASSITATSISIGSGNALDTTGSTQTKSGSLFLGGQLQASSGTIKGNFSMGNSNKIVFANPDNEYIGESGDVIQTVSFDSVETYLDSNADSTSAFRIFSEGLAGGGTIRLTLRDDGALVLTNSGSISGSMLKVASGTATAFEVTGTSTTLGSSSMTIVTGSKFQVGTQLTHTENVKFVISSDNDQMLIEETDAGADSKKWLIKGDGGNFVILAPNDAWSSFPTYWNGRRSGATFSTTTFSGGAFEISTTGTGLIQRSPDGTCHRLDISNANAISAVTVPCP